GDAVDLAAGSWLLLLVRLLHGRARLRHPPHPAPKDSVCPAADDRSYGHPVDSAVSAAVSASAVARPQRPFRLGVRSHVRRQPLPEIRRRAPRPRVLEGLRLHPGLAALHLERLLLEADDLVARHLFRPDV